MRQVRPKFKDFPPGVRNAMISVFVAWGFFIGYNLYVTGTISIYHLTMGMLVCFAVFSLKGWTRIFVVIYNLIMAIMIGFEIYYAFHSGGDFSIILIAGKIISIVLFIISSVLLLRDDVKQFFQEQNR